MRKCPRPHLRQEPLTSCCPSLARVKSQDSTGESETLKTNTHRQPSWASVRSDPSCLSHQERKVCSVVQYHWHISLPTSLGLWAVLKPNQITFLDTIFFSSHTAYWFSSHLFDSCVSFSFPQSSLYQPQIGTLSLGSTLTPQLSWLQPPSLSWWLPNQVSEPRTAPQTLFYLVYWLFPLRCVTEILLLFSR